jgi:outer membrane receptor for monomeric catechols
LAVTLNQLLGKHWSLGSSYRYTEADLEEKFAEVPAANRDVSATLHQLTLFAIFNHASGFFAQFASVWSQQSNRGYSPEISGDHFWQHNFYVGYRLTRRAVEARLGLLNLTDQNYRLNPLTLYSELPRDRTLAVSLKLNF